MIRASAPLTSSAGCRYAPDHHHEGRLELTWTNKHKRLLAHEDGPREWLPPSDYRVAEGSHWLIEVKMDKEMSSADVQAKRRAALDQLRQRQRPRRCRMALPAPLRGRHRDRKASRGALRTLGGY